MEGWPIKKTRREVAADTTKVLAACFAIFIVSAAFFIFIIFYIVQLTGLGSYSDIFASSKTEDFKYYSHAVIDDGFIAHVTTLTTKGKKKETITVPRELNGAIVDSIGVERGVKERGFWESTKLKRAYLPCLDFETKKNFFYQCPNLEKVLAYRNFATRLKLSKKDTPNLKIYITSEEYDADLYGGTNVYRESDEYVDIYFANVTYEFNYENEIGGYYMIDDYDYGEKIVYVPIDPVREGYSFGGWYREPECISKWDFTRDTLPEAKIEDGVVKYQETKLYAKWNAVEEI